MITQNANHLQPAHTGSTAKIAFGDHIAHRVTAVIVRLDWCLFGAVSPDVARDFLGRAGRFLGLDQRRITPVDSVAQDEQPRLAITSRLEPRRYGLQSIGYALARGPGADAEMPLERGPVLGVVVADDRLRSGLTLEHTFKNLGMILDQGFCSVRLGVQVEPAIRILSPPLAHERIRVSKVHRPVARPLPRNVERIDQMHRSVVTLED